MVMMSNTLYDRVSESIWNTKQFQADYSRLYFSTVYESFANQKHGNAPSVGDVKKLIQAAATLSLSSLDEHRKAAYRIAISAWKMQIEDLNLVNVVHVILSRLGNFPAADFMFKESKANKNYEIPSGLLYELIQHEEDNTIDFSSKKVLLTDFQKRLWKSFKNDKIISISAPTSAGKSFTLQKYLLNEIIDGRANYIIYLVPSRALLGQIAESISNELAELKINVPVITIPETKENLDLKQGIYVFTQERAYALFALDRNVKFDIIVVDEAQTINAGARGVLLQVVIEYLIAQNARAKFFFGSPFSKNPNYFSFLFDDEMKLVKERESPVIQNLIGADVSPQNPRVLELKLYDSHQFHSLASVQLERELTNEKSLFSYICYFLGKNSKNIIYAGSPSACEDIADKIRQWIDAETEKSGMLLQISDETKDLAQFIRDHIHPQYFLAEMVERGVSFHYGKMPAVLRRAIEDNFSSNPDMKYLVCTSTLLHGVNLPAKNLFLLKPSEGERWLASNAETISSPSFWNLAGRAGRLGKDFEGNVFLVNKDAWKKNPLDGEREQVIQASFYKILASHKSSILAIARSEVDSLRNLSEGETAESAFVKLYSDYRRGVLEKTFNRSPEIIEETYLSELSTAFDNLKFDIPDEIIQNNIGISPHRQQKIFDYIISCIAKNDFEKLLPLHPQSSDAWESYNNIYSSFEKYFDGREVPSKSPRRLASISLSWMRGVSYREMIQKQVDLSKTKKLPTIIRETMETIENVLRFKLVQQSKCYIEILKHALSLHGLTDRSVRIPSLPLYLEIGAASGTMVSLIGMGFSRTTAGLINEKAADKSMDRVTSYKWLVRENWETSDLPRVCKQEIKAILNR